MEESTSSSLQLHRTESFPSNNLMMGHNHHRPFLSSPNGGDDDGGGGPNQNDSGANEVERPRPPAPTSTSTRSTCSNILFRGDAGAAAVPNISWSASGGSAVAAFAATVNTLQPFDSCLSNNKTFKFPGEGEMAAPLGFPFTAAQWKELERQAMIYKYMMAAVSVPSDLLLPADPTTTPPLGNNNGSLYNLRYPNRDLEPGRCKRTDGKKWRCSRDVAPHQKYCERHMHRGRPRSRKPVELHSSSVVDSNNNNSGKKSRLNQSTLHSPPTPPKPNAQANNTYSTPLLQPKDALVLDSTGCQNIFASSTYKEPNRVFGWAMENEVAAAANEVEQHWHHLTDTKKGVPTEDSIYGSNASILQQGYGEEPLNLFSYADFVPENIDNRNHHCQLFLNSDLVSSKHPHIDQNCTSRGFIDAWSDGDLKTIDESSVLSSEGNNLSPSSLTLSMAMVAGNAIDEGMKLASDPDHHKPKDCPVSWLPFNSGGPLAEVLQPSSIASGSNPASPYNSNGDSSPPATTVSSPTGIFNKALLFSHSDGSVCNSPTLAASAAPPEVVAFRWLS